MGILNRSDEALAERAKRPLGGVAVGAVASVRAQSIKEGNHGYDNSESRQLRLVAMMTDFAEAQLTLDEYRGSMSRTEIVKTLEPIITYNHVLREMIDTEQYSTVSEILRFVGGSLLYLGFEQDVIRYTIDRTKAVVNGMRHEIAAESVLSWLRGVDEINSAGIEDEIEGKDIILNYRGRILALDIKSSKDSALNAMMNRRGRDKSVPIWSGFSNRDFGDNLILMNEQLHSRDSYYLEQLRFVEDLVA